MPGPLLGSLHNGRGGEQSKGFSRLDNRLLPNYATNGFGTNTIRLLDFNKAVQQHASTTQLPTTIPLAPGMDRVIWVGYKVAGSLDRGHQGRVCRHYKRPASDPTHYDSASINIGVKANGLKSTHNHLAGDPTHYEYIGVKAKLLA
ncbi:hypothetical protein B0H14DRAFT_2574787 [Mycena olivaceomarginata]|nr:hypothetical protein B0H14DRAFT_2574787 [Mycena olivaceomarginata]